jgi:hypothetical protein
VVVFNVHRSQKEAVLQLQQSLLTLLFLMVGLALQYQSLITFCSAALQHSLKNEVYLICEQSQSSGIRGQANCRFLQYQGLLTARLNKKQTLHWTLEDPLLLVFHAGVQHLLHHSFKAI